MSAQGKVYYIDTESDGFVRKATKLHMITVKVVGTRQKFVFRNNSTENRIEEGLKFIAEADTLIGHRIIGHDLPLMKQLHDFEPQAKIVDTLVLSRVLYPNLSERDFRLVDDGRLPREYQGSHSLGAWGHRLGEPKGDYAEAREQLARSMGIVDKEEITKFVWGEWNQDMEDYGLQDTETGLALYEKIMQDIDLMSYPRLPIVTEHRMEELMTIQEANGVPFNLEAAKKLHAELDSLMDPIDAECCEAFPNRFEPKYVFLEDNRNAFNNFNWEALADQEIADSLFDLLSNGDVKDSTAKLEIPKKSITYKDASRASRVAGAPYSPVEYVDFNPGSRPQVIDRLLELGWQPDEFTEKGNPSLTEDSLERAAKMFPIAKPIADRFMMQKLRSQLATGEQAWINHCTSSGRIHHTVTACGAVTGRAIHSNPNLGQVPRVVKKKIVQEDGSKKEVVAWGREGKWGADCRALFYVPDDWGVMVGADLSGIELRCLAHYMAEFDGGEYGRELLNGDVHTKNMKAFGLDNRDQSKTAIYALLYGAGDEKMGSIAVPKESLGVQKKVGADMKARFLKETPALAKVLKQIKKDLKRGYLVGLDGRRLYARSQHSALNTLLQSAGALIAKYWILQIDDDLADRGFVNGWEDYANMLWIHDEVQLAVRHGLEAEIAKIMVEAAGRTGEFLNFRLPVAAESKSGPTWQSTH